jgi:hypothetical protein
MENSEHKEGFENFLKEKADAYKMYPSEKVWNSLNDQLHPRIKWPYLAMAVIFLGLGFGGKIFDSRYNVHDSGLISSSKISLDNQQSPEIKNEPASEGQALVIDIRQRVKSKTAGQLSTSGSHLKEPVKSSIETGPLIYTSQPDDENSHFSNAFKEKLNVPIFDDQKYLPGNIADNTLAPLVIHSDKAYENAGSMRMLSSAPGKSSRIRSDANSFSKSVAIATNQGNSDLAQNDLAGLSASVAKTSSLTSQNQVENTWTENHSAAIRVKKPGKNRLGWQLYFGPTISYRSLYGTINKNGYSNQMLFASLPGSPKDINSAVSQFPSAGMELGTAMVYSIGKNLRIKGGLQFNYSQYNINAFNYAAEIAPLSAAGIGHTEIKALTNIRNFDGYSNTELRNEHFSISMPIGAELMVIGNKDIAFNIGGSIQPAVMLNNQAYLLSTNLRNYAKAPSLYRNFNINTALEAFLTFNRGSLRWNVGPQIRYQLLSSYKESYPIKEHLYDYGFKVGVTKTLR